jgi:cytochrome c5
MKDCSNRSQPAPANSLHLLLLCLLSAPVLADPAPAPSQRQLELFSSNCVQCHARPGIGAPLIGNADDWRERQAQGEEVLLLNVVEGVGGMPPLGYCSACDEADFRVLIRLLLPASESQP